MPTRAAATAPLSKRKQSSHLQVRHTGTIAAARAKAHLLSLMDEVSRDGLPVIITRRGKPLVQIAPLDPVPAAPDIFGCMRGTLTITGDIVGPEPDQWEAMQ